MNTEKNILSDSVAVQSFMGMIDDPVLMIDLEDEGSILEANDAFLVLTGWRKEQIIGWPLHQLVIDEEKGKAKAIINELVKVHHYNSTLELRQESGASLAVNLNINKIKIEGREKAFICVRREEDKTDEELKQNFLKVVEHSRAAVFLLDKAFKVKSVNQTAVELFKYPAEDLKNRFASTLIFPAKPTRFKELVHRLYENPSVTTETICKKRNGEEFHISMTLAPVTDIDDSVSGYSLIIRDITERVMTEEKLRKSRLQLRELARHIDNVREQERKNIAGDVHDVLGQNLTALKLDTLWLKKKLEAIDPTLLNRVNDMAELIDITAEHIHKISSQLRPPGLDHLGLVSAMEYLVGDLRKRSTINYNMTFDPPNLEVKEPFATPVFRIFQELMTNVLRHSKAGNVEISIQKIENLLILKVRDDGIGLNQERINQSRTFGILGMRERALSIGGTFDIQSRLNLGTTVKVIVPLGGKVESGK